MERKKFIEFRKKLDKTQAQLAHLMGISLKTIKSYEQGLRAIPFYIEREILFLVSKKFESLEKKKPCWMVNRCSKHIKSGCPAWEFKLGTLCWLINGSICNNGGPRNSDDKIRDCQSCEAFPSILKTVGNT